MILLMWGQLISHYLSPPPFSAISEMYMNYMQTYAITNLVLVKVILFYSIKVLKYYKK